MLIKNHKANNKLRMKDVHTHSLSLSLGRFSFKTNSHSSLIFRLSTVLRVCNVVRRVVHRFLEFSVHRYQVRFERRFDKL